MADMELACPHCSQPLEAPEEMAGEIVACPACGEPIQLPADDASTCPECGSELESGAILCVACGYHLGLGRKLDTEIE